MQIPLDVLPVFHTMRHVDPDGVISAVPEYFEPSGLVPSTLYEPPTFCASAGVTAQAATARPRMILRMCLLPRFIAGDCTAFEGAKTGLVRSRRLELPRGFPHSDLNAARLPIPPRPQAGEGSVASKYGVS